MSLFAKKKMTHAEIVAPLKTMAETLSSYIKDQAETIGELNVKKREIDNQIEFSNEEIEKSNHTVEQIKKMVNLPKIKKMPADSVPSDE
jgi:hypothetical protein